MIEGLGDFAKEKMEVEANKDTLNQDKFVAPDTYVMTASDEKMILDDSKLNGLRERKADYQQKLDEAKQHLDTLKSDFKGEILRLKELHQGSKAMQKLLNSAEELPRDIHTFINQILDEQKHNMSDQAFRQEAPLGLEKAVLDAGNPPGNKLVNFSLVLNQEVGDYRGQDSEDMLKRSDLSDSVKVLTRGEWEVYLSQYLLDQAKEELKAVEAIISNSKKDQSGDMASVDAGSR